MAKKYTQGIVSPKGFNMSAPEPVDQRAIVEYLSDLTTLNHCYQGIEVMVVASNYDKYKLIALPSSNISNWVLANGAGDIGPAGPQGPAGADGESAYELYISQGGTLSLQDWLTSLKGLKGDTGLTGATGLQGPIGPVGPQGPQGIEGPEGAPSVKEASEYSVLWKQDLTFDVTASRYYILNELYSAPPLTTTLAVADITYDRIDLIKATSEGVIEVITGNPGVIPQPPNYNSAIEFPLKYILVKANALVPSGYTNTLIYDENLGAPTEWSSVITTLPGFPTGSVILNATDYAYSGITSIKFGPESSVHLNANSAFKFNELINIHCRLKLDTPVTSLKLTWNMRNTTSGVSYTETTNLSNFVNIESTEWQVLTLDRNFFSNVGVFDNQELNTLSLGFTYSGVGNLFIDVIYLQTSVDNILIPNLYPSANLQSVTSSGNETSLPIIAEKFIKKNGTAQQLLLADGGDVPLKTSSLVNDGDDTLYPFVNTEDLKLKQPLNTGFVLGLTLSINVDNTKFNIASGYYVCTDYTDKLNPITTIKYFAGQTAIIPQYLATSNVSYIALDVNGAIVQSASTFTNEQRRSLAILGAVVHSNRLNINTTNEIKAPIIGETNQLHDVIKAIGSLNLSGNVFSPNGANMRLNKSAGTIFGLGINASDITNPHVLTLPEALALNFRYRLRGGTEYTDTQNINPTQYDLNGVLTIVGNNNFTIQRINVFQSGIVRVQYGQKEYNSLSEARAGVQVDPFTTEQNILENAIFRCYLIVKKEVTDLSAGLIANDVNFIPVDKFGNVVGGAGVALTYDTIVAALGFTPENVANKQNSLTADGTGVKYPTVDAITAPNIPAARLGSSTFTSVQHIQDLFHSAGWTSGGVITNAGGGLITVSAGTGLIRAINSDVATIYFTDFPASTPANVVLVDGSQNYIYVEYNAGVPRVIATTIQRADYNTSFLIGAVYRIGTTLHINSTVKTAISDHAGKMIAFNKEVMPYARANGSMISEVATRGFSITAGTFWNGLVRFTTNAFSTATGSFFYFYRNGVGGWTKVPTQTQINNTQYDNGTGTLATLSNNKYGIHWVFIDTDGDTYVVYGQGDYTLIEAQNEMVPASLPVEITSHGFVVGKIIIQKSLTTFTQIESAFAMGFSSAMASEHNSLAGLQGGAAGEYYHLTSTEKTDLTDGGSTTLHYHQADRDYADAGIAGVNTNKVPYTGATTNVNLGSNNLTASNLTGNYVYANVLLQLPNLGYITVNGNGADYFKGTRGQQWESDIKLKYATDLSGSYDSRTLIDKGYLDTRLGSTGTGFELISNKNIANGYAGLDANLKINPSHLPALAVTDTFVVASQVAMLALVAETGDVAVRTDLNKSFILRGSNPTLLADWQELLTPTDAVQSVFGRSGTVTAQANDYTADQILETVTKVFVTPAEKTAITHSNRTALDAVTSANGTNTGDNAVNSLYSGLVSNATHTGEVTGSTALTITEDAVTNTKLANMTVNTIKGRITAGAGDPEDLTADNVRTIINVSDGAQKNSDITKAEIEAKLTGAIVSHTHDYSSVFAPITHNHSWSNITSGVPTTIGGYGITDYNSLGDARWLGINAKAADSNLLDGIDSSSFIQHYLYVDVNGVLSGIAPNHSLTYINTPDGDWGNVITFGNPLGKYATQLFGKISSNVLMYRSIDNGIAASWKTLWDSANLINPITGTGTTNYIPKFTGAGSLGNSSIVDDGTNVGIGTTAPAASLAIGINSPNVNTVHYLQLQNQAAGYVQWALSKTSENNLSITNRGTGSENLPVMTFQYTATGGNVGIGTTSPQTKLDILGQGIFGTMTTNRYNRGGLAIQNNTGEQTNIYLWQVGIASSWIGHKANDSNLYITNDYHGNGLGTAIRTITINPDGNVGIGYSTGTEITNNKLAVNGSGYFNGTVTATDFIGSSDLRLKENIQALQPKKINSNYKTFNFIGSEQQRVGIIAQELEIEHPEFVRTDGNGIKSVSYTDLHNAEIAYLKDKIEKLEELVNKLIG